MKIIKYGAGWCGPCRTTSAMLKNSGYNFEEIDIDEHEDIAQSKNIKSIPVIEFFNDSDSTPIYTHVGLLTKSELDNIIKTYSL